MYTAVSQRTKKMLLTYSDMLQYSSFEDRYQYLNLHGKVGLETFGSNRYFNQKLYQSSEWKHLRHEIIVRDHGCDLGVEGREIFGPITIHHINPINVEMLVEGDPLIFDPENLICVSPITHKAIHYGSFDGTPQDYSPRYRNDTCPWKEG